MRGTLLISLALLAAGCSATSVKGIDVIVRFKASNQAPLQAHNAPSPLPKTRTTLHRLLKAHAAAQQAPVLERIKGRKTTTTFWLDNSLLVRNADPALIEELRAMELVSEVVEDGAVQLPEMDRAPDHVVRQETLSKEEEEGAGKPQSNIAALNTGPLWAEGYTGSGVVVATIDSGVRWTHEALRGNYRGFLKNPDQVDHDYAMWTSNSSFPLTPDTVDIYGHGTHVTGTLAGQAQGIGMAPNATWIHAKAFDWTGVTTQSVLIEAAQWVLCPTKRDHSDADCSKGAHVISCSFGGNSSLTWLNPSVKAMRAAGAWPIFASGNVNAFKCGSVMEPAGFEDSIAVGGVNSGRLYPSSGKGPGLDGKQIKPDFVAPSFAIRSALSSADSGREAYTRLTGTSMSTPHVAGAFALLMSSQNATSSVTQADLLATLRSTANQKQKKPIFAPSQCGGTPYNRYPNNIYGWGLPDVCKAAASLPGVSCGGDEAVVVDNYNASWSEGYCCPDYCGGERNYCYNSHGTKFRYCQCKDCTMPC